MTEQETQKRNSEVVQLFVDGKSYGQIAAKLRITRSTVAGIIHRAKKPRKQPSPPQTSRTNP